MDVVDTSEKYISLLRKRNIGVKGFKFSISNIKFFPAEKRVENPFNMNLSLILLDSPTEVFAGVWTRNIFPGAPVIISKKMKRNKKVSGVFINNKISNVAVTTGVEDAQKILFELEKLLNLEEGTIFPASTGIIGWRLPIKDILKGLPAVVENIGKVELVEVSKNIMTTDTYPKLHSIKIGKGKIVVVAKGAGMIEPNMATMLCFVCTDISISKKDLQDSLAETVEDTFNCISVDSDQSTSDTVLAFSSCKISDVSVADFKNGLKKVLSLMAEDIVRNGEGVEHVIKVHIKGAKNRVDAKGVGKAVINSPLVKSAIFGNDPNVGRIISSIGDYYGNLGVKNIATDKIVVKIGENCVFKSGFFNIDSIKEKKISTYLENCQLKTGVKKFPEHNRCVDIYINLNLGDGFATVIGADLTYDYVKENADYRS